jgi:tetratricopeptide (TPR) repeat protein
MQDVIGKRMRDSCMPERVVECTGLYIEALTDLATALGVEDTNHPLIDKCYEWAFDLTRALDPQSEMHAGVCLAIASLHEKRGRYADAKRICQSVLEELKPESYKLRAQALAGLALAELGCGNDAEAEQLLKQASQFRSHCEGASPGLPEILVYLAAIKFRRTEYSAAESLIRESLEIRRKVVGTDPHFWVGQTLGVLAHTCVKLGRHDEAEQYFVEAVSMVRETVGVGHEQYKSYALDLLRCYIVQGKQDAAESFARHLLQEVAADDAIRADVQEMLKRRPDLPSAGNSGSKFSSTSGFTEDSDLHGATLLPRSNKAGRNPSRHRRIGRNDPCPCGSGKKFKRCCGRPTSDDTRIGP